MNRYRSYQLPPNAEVEPGRVIDYDGALHEPTTHAGRAEPHLSRRDLVRYALWFAAGGGTLGLLTRSVRQPISPTGLTEAQWQQLGTRVDRMTQDENLHARTTENQAVQWSAALNNAMDQQIVRNVPMLRGEVRIKDSLFVRNPLCLDAPNQSAHTLGLFVPGLYYGVLAPGTPDALVKIVPDFLAKSSMVYAPDDPNSTDFVSYVNVRPSSVGVGSFELLAVDEANKPLVEPDGVTWMRLCVPGA